MIEMFVSVEQIANILGIKAKLADILPDARRCLCDGPVDQEMALRRCNQQ